MIPKKTNPPMPEQVLTRIRNTHGFIEGEDFTVECPPWCTPMEPGDFPTEEGWYLAVSHFSGFEEPRPVCEPVVVSISGDGLVVIEMGGDMHTRASLRDFWWVGKMTLPECVNLRVKK
jgi:hypothetical protein